MRKSGALDQQGHALFAALPGAAPLSEPEAARTAGFAALDDLVEAGLAIRHERCANCSELRGIGGEVWLLNDCGVTRLR